jgi:hypothetical protein
VNARRSSSSSTDENGSANGKKPLVLVCGVSGVGPSSDKGKGRMLFALVLLPVEAPVAGGCEC